MLVLVTGMANAQHIVVSLDLSSMTITGQGSYSVVDNGVFIGTIPAHSISPSLITVIPSDSSIRKTIGSDRVVTSHMVTTSSHRFELASVLGRTGGHGISESSVFTHTLYFTRYDDDGNVIGQEDRIWGGAGNGLDTINGNGMYGGDVTFLSAPFNVNHYHLFRFEQRAVQSNFLNRSIEFIVRR